jgi:hypothetical protein
VAQQLGNRNDPGRRHRAVEDNGPGES